MTEENLIIDRDNGEFKGTTGRFDFPDSRYTFNSTIRGTFHGSTANSVTGLHMGKVTWEDSGTTYTQTIIAGER